MVRAAESNETVVQRRSQSGATAALRIEQIARRVPIGVDEDSIQSPACDAPHLGTDTLRERADPHEHLVASEEFRVREAGGVR